MRLILIGAEDTAAELVGRLAPQWQITVIDDSRRRLQAFGVERGVQLVHGDGSSVVVLKKAGAAEADALVAVTDSDEVNLEACLLARSLGVRTVLARAARVDGLAAYRAEEIPAVSGARELARGLRTMLEGPYFYHGSIAGGRGEIVEIIIVPSSEAVGMKLADIHPLGWIMGGVLRDGEFLIPHGDTVLQRNDRVTIVGHSSVIPSVAAFFGGRRSSFPLSFGRNVLVVPGSERRGEVLEEALWITRSTPAGGLVCLLEKPSDGGPDESASQVAQTIEAAVSGEVRFAEAGQIRQAMLTIAAAESVGLLMVDGGPPQRPRSARGYLRARNILGPQDELRAPLFLARGSFPYRRILLVATPDEECHRVSEVALDLAGVLGAEVEVLTVMEPEFLTEADWADAHQRVLDEIIEMGRMQHLRVSGRVVQGNPVVEAVASSENCDLLVLAYDSRVGSRLRPGIARYIMAGSRSSVMVLGNCRE